MRGWALAGMALLAASPAWAQERDYCPERPGLDTPPCIIDRGRVSVETAIADWTRDDQPDSRSDTVLIGDTLVRVGLSDTIEARLGWTPYGHARTRDKASNAVSSIDGVGDVTLGLKASLLHPGGDGLSIAVLPQVSLPVGRTPIGAGDWGAGLLLPVSYSLSKSVQLAATPEVDAAVNASGSGRHLAYSGTIGLGWGLADAVTLTGEVQALRDEDPSGYQTQTLAALSLAWKAASNLQFDVLGAHGLNADAPDFELYAGVSRRF